MRFFIRSGVLLFFVFSSLAAFSQAVPYTSADPVNYPRHETPEQRIIEVRFNQTLSGNTDITQWTVKIGGALTTITGLSNSSLGPFGAAGIPTGSSIFIKFDATVIPGHTATQPFILPSETNLVTISFVNIGSTLTTAVGGATVANFGPLQSLNKHIPDCSDVKFKNSGIAPSALQDICAPVVTDFWTWTYEYSLLFRNSTKWTSGTSGGNVLNIKWNDPSNTISNIPGFLSDGGANPNTNFYNVAGGIPSVFISFRTGFNPSTFLLDGSNAFSYPTNSNICNFVAIVYPWHPSYYACNSVATLVKPTQFDSYDTDDKNTGTLVLNPTAPPATATSDLVCLGSNVGMKFSDNSVYNCIGDGTKIPTPGQGKAGTPINNQQRWVRFIYCGVDGPTGNIPDISVGGVQVTDPSGNLLPAYVTNPILASTFPSGQPNPTTRGYVAANIGGADANGVITLPAFATASAIQTLLISTATAINQAVGQRFHVTLQYWNICNPYPSNAPVQINADWVEIITRPPTPTFSPNPPNFCENQSDANYQLTASGTGGIYKWYSVFPLATAGDLEKTGATFNPRTEASPLVSKTPAATATTNFFLTETLGNGCESLPLTVPFTILKNVTGGAITHPGPNPVCSGDIPAALANSVGPTNGTGSYTYQWEISTASSTTGFTDAVGAGATSIGPFAPSVAVSQTTYYRRRAMSGTVTGSGSCTVAYSNVITITVNTTPAGGSIGNGQTICENPGDPTTITNVTGGTGGNGTPNYQWELSTTGGGIGFSPIGLAVSATYDPPSGLLVNTFYRRKNTSGICVVNSSYSNEIQVIVNNLVSPGTIGSAQGICSGVTPIGLTGTPATGGDGIAINYQWEQSTSGAGGPFSNSPGSGALQNYSPPALTVSTWYRRKASSGVCPDTYTTPPIKITVSPLPSVTNVTGGGAVCSGNPAPDIVFTFSGTAPYSFTIHPSTAADIVVAGYNSNTYTIAGPQPVATTTYQITALTDASGCTATSFGSAALVTIGGIAPIVDSPFALDISNTCENGVSTIDPGVLFSLTAPSANTTNFTLVYQIDGLPNRSKSFDTDGAGDPTAVIKFSDVELNSVTPSPHDINIVAIQIPSGCQTIFNTHLSFTVNPKASIVTEPTPQIVCALDNTTFTVVNTASPVATYQWQESTNGGTVFNNISNNATYSGTASASLVISNVSTTFNNNLYHVVLTTPGSCTINSNDVLLTVNPLPTVTNRTPVVCSDSPGGTTATVDLTANNSFINPGTVSITWWQNYDGITRVFSNPIITPASYIVSNSISVYAKVQNTVGNACVNFATATYTVNPKAVIATQPLILVSQCTGGDVSFNVSATGPGTNYQWQSSTNGGVVWNNVVDGIFSGVTYSGSLSNTLNLTSVINALNNNQYRVLVGTTGSCSLPSNSSTLNVNSSPLANTITPDACSTIPGGNTSVVDLTTYNAGINNTGTVSITWYQNYDPATKVFTNLIPAGSALNQEQQWPVTTGDQLWARVESIAAGCVGAASANITVNPTPFANPIGGATDVCQGSTTLVYQVTTVNSGATYQWTIPPQFTKLAGGTPDFFVLLQFPSMVDPGVPISVIETSIDGCPGASQPLVITVRNSPVISGIIGPIDVCENEAGVSYSVPNLASTTFAWTVPAGASIIAGQGTNKITVNFGTLPGNVKVTPTTSSGSCPGSPASIAVNIKGRPELTPNLSNTICSDGSSQIILSVTNPVVFPVVTYSVINAQVNPQLNPASRANASGGDDHMIFNDVFENQTGGPLSVRYTIVPDANGCSGTPSDVILNVNPEPVLDTSPISPTCSGTPIGVILKVATGSFAADQFNIQAINTNGLTFTSGNPLSGPAYFGGASEIADDVWINKTGAPVDVHYTIRPKNSGTSCLGDPGFDVVVTILPEPVVTGFNDIVCSGSSSIQTITADIPGTTFSWTAGPITGSILVNPSFGTGNTVTSVFKNLGTTQGNVKFTVTGKFNGCVGNTPGNISIDVNPAPIANTIANIVVCSDAVGGNTKVVDLTLVQPNINPGGLGITYAWYQDAAKTLPILAPATYMATDGIAVFAEVDNGQCKNMTSVTYVINKLPSVSASITSSYNGAQLTCSTASDGQITAIGLNGTAPYRYSKDNGTNFFTTGTFNGLSASNNPFTIRVKDFNGCIADSGPLSFVPPLVLSGTTVKTKSYHGADVSCKASSDGEITVTGIDGTITGANGYTYRLLEVPSNTTGDASGVYKNLGAGSYTFIINDANGCQFITTPVQLNDPNPLSANASLTAPVSCNGVSDGSVSVNALGGTITGLTYTYTLNQPPALSNTTGIFTGLPSSTYTVHVTDDNNCSVDTSPILVTQPSALTVFASVLSNYNGSKISCHGANDAEIAATANGGNGGYTFILVEDLTNLSGVTDGSFENLGPGNYTIKVTDSKNCQKTTSAVNITEPALVGASVQLTQPISCHGSNDASVQVLGSGGTGSYSFTNNTTSSSNSSGVFNGLVANTYNFSIGDQNGCPATTQIIITEPTQVVAGASVTSNYNGSQISCNGFDNGIIKVTASGGTGGLQYIFDQFTLTNTTGASTGIFTNVSAGVGYTFTVKDGNNCTVQTSFIDVTEPSALTPSRSITSNYHGQNISCSTATDGEITVQATGGTGTIHYFFDQVPSNTTGNTPTVAPTGIFTGVGAGSNYTFTIKDANNCSIVTAPISIAAPTPLDGSALVATPYAGGREISCKGANDGKIDVSTFGGTPDVLGYTYAISPDLNGVGVISASTFSSLTAGNYTITIKDQNTCTKVISNVIITEPDLLTATASIASDYHGQQITCVGASDGIIKVTPTGGTPPNFTYILNQIPANITGQHSGSFTGVPAGTYTVQVADPNGCNVTTTGITINPPPAIVPNTPTINSNYSGASIKCNGGGDGVMQVTASGGVAPYTFVLNEILSNNSGASSGIYSDLPQGTYSFTITDVNQCSALSPSKSIADPLPIAAGTHISSNYHGAAINCFADANGAITVDVVPGGGTLMSGHSYKFFMVENPTNVTGASSGVFSGVRAGTYTFRVTDDNSCSFTTSPQLITAPAILNVTSVITSDYGSLHYPLSCQGASDGAIAVNNSTGGTQTAGYHFSISPDINATGVNNTGTFNQLTQGVYIIKMTDDNGCTASALPLVIIDPPVLVAGSVGNDQTLCINDPAGPVKITEAVPPFGGIGDYQESWEKSVDKLTWSPIAGETGSGFQPPSNLTQTTYYRRGVMSGTCNSTLPVYTEPVTITINPLPTVVNFSANAASICEGNPLFLKFKFTGRAPYTFNYSDGSALPFTKVGLDSTLVIIPNFTDNKTYTLLSVKDFNGCSAINIPPPVAVSVIKQNAAFTIQSPSPQCSGNKFIFKFTVDPNVSYTWNWGDGPDQLLGLNPSDTISHRFYNGTSAGKVTYPITLTAHNAACAPKTTNNFIDVFPNVIANVQPSANVICSGNPVTFTNLTQGAAIHTWVVTDPLNNVVYSSNDQNAVVPFVNNTAPKQDYKVVYTGSNLNNCFATKTFTVTVYQGATPSFFFSPNPVPDFIAGQAVMNFTNTSVPLNDDINFRYDWDYGSNAVPGTETTTVPSTITYKSAGDKTVKLTITNILSETDHVGCVYPTDRHFTIIKPPLRSSFSITPLASCFPTELHVVNNSPGADTFDWTVVDQTGQTVLKSNLAQPTFLIANPGTYDILLTASFAATHQSAPTAEVNGIEVYNRPSAIFEARPTVLFIPDTELKTFNFSTGATGYTWNFDDNATSTDFEPSHLYQLEGSYQIVLVAEYDHGQKDINGDGILDANVVCYDTTSRTITAREGGQTKIPNAFTPNTSGPSGGTPSANGVNDVFLPLTRGVEEFNMQIFDRWGTLIFESRDKNQGWDGYDKNGSLLPAGVYVFKLTMRLSNGQRTTQVGDLTLLR